MRASMGTRDRQRGAGHRHQRQDNRPQASRSRACTHGHIPTHARQAAAGQRATAHQRQASRPQAIHRNPADRRPPPATPPAHRHRRPAKRPPARRNTRARMNTPSLCPSPTGGGSSWRRRGALRVRERKSFLGMRHFFRFRRGGREKGGGSKKKIEVKVLGHKGLRA